MKPNRPPCLLLIPLCFWFSAVSLAATGNVLLAHDGIEITFEEAFAYSVKHTNPDAYEISMSKPLAVFRVVENLYVLKRIASLADGTGLMSPAEQEDLVTDFLRRSLLERYLDNAISKRMVDIDWDGLAAAEYAERKAELIIPEEVRVDHLLVSIEAHPFEQFVSKVRAVQAQLAAGADFGELIAEYSDDPSVAKNAGDLGFFNRKRMQPTFSDAAFALASPGDIAGPVMTRFGAHFIRLIERKPESVAAFEEVRSSLMAEVKQSTLARLREEFLFEIRTEIDANLVRLDEQALLTQFLAAYAEREATAPSPD